jgi:hypothetical protein
MKYPIGSMIVVNTNADKYHGKIGRILNNDRIAQGRSGMWDYEVQFINFKYVFCFEEIDKVHSRQTYFQFK